MLAIKKTTSVLNLDRLGIDWVSKGYHFKMESRSDRTRYVLHRGLWGCFWFQSAKPSLCGIQVYHTPLLICPSALPVIRVGRIAADERVATWEQAMSALERDAAADLIVRELRPSDDPRCFALLHPIHDRSKHIVRSFEGNSRRCCIASLAEDPCTGSATTVEHATDTEEPEELIHIGV